ncbi:MAG: AAA family ATPase [Euryarchaeota archaeon]|nr:AAA family ATPase [Euryarchaeota archaeon]
MSVYNSNLEHIRDELYRIKQIVHLHLDDYGVEQVSANSFHGLFISRDEVDAILQTTLYGHEADACSATEHREIERLTREIAKKKIESIKNGKELRLHLLEELFHLTPFEMGVLAICLAPELDLQYEKLYAYLQDDVTRKQPSVDLVLGLLSSTEDRFAAINCFSPAAPLIRNRIVHLTSPRSDDPVPILSRSIKVDDRILYFLMGSDEVDARIQSFSYMADTRNRFEDLILSGDEKNRLSSLIKWYSRTETPVIFFFHGPYGTGKKMASEVVCNELKLPLLMVDMKAVIGSEFPETMDAILREALLQRSSVCLLGFDAVLKAADNDEGTAVINLIKRLDRFPNWIFISSETPWEPTLVLKKHKFVSLAFPRPSFVLRKQMWKTFLNGRNNVSDDVDIANIASKFNFSAGQMKDALFSACNIAEMKNSGEPVLSMDTLFGGCKAQSGNKLTRLAMKIEPRHIWDDIVLPEDVKEQLVEVGGYIRHKGKVYADWGFGRKLSSGRGLNALFSGPSGTGKTMAAGIIAGAVELDLYRIDLSGVVSKYIGETEKNLKKIFEEAETSNAILLFDEADAIFGKRSEVKDSHDRYANIETSYLLQRMEEYDGVVILASNFKKNIDDAFLRRMHFVIEFPLPDEKLREKIWAGIFPEETPLGDSVDFTFLARFKVTGGNIKNIAISAAFLAAGDSATVEMEHLIRATKREFQKMGKLCTPGDFGEYYGVVK